MISYLTGKNAEHKHTNKTRKRTHVQYFDQVTMPSFRQIAISGGGRVTLRILCKFGRENQLLCLHSQGWIYHQTMFSPPARWGLLYRFYQSCSSPPSSSFSSSASSSSILPPLPPLPRPLLPCQLLAKLFANFGAQCALPDLNLGPSQLSAHRWTSTWDLPSSVRTAGPQPGAFRAQCAPLDLKSQIECQKICQIECQIECEKICQIKCHKICQIECQEMPDRMLEDMPDRMPEGMPD